tara:strand:+ start:10561 stop:11493 length:933 start_codon:yes stop_codon:yes gene_type:complete
MSIFFYCPWSNKNEWLKKIQLTFKKSKVFSIEDNPNLEKIECAIVWDLPNHILGKMKNVKVFFSMGAGVDHILNLTNYKGQTIIRLKDIIMAERMSNHVLSQILYFQLNLPFYKETQKKKIWPDDIEPKLNASTTVGILGLGYLGSFVGETLKKLNYNIIGFKNSKPTSKYLFPVYYLKKDLKKFITNSDIIVSILPSTHNTKYFINKIFLNLMKKNALLISVGRGSILNEKDLISHIKNNENFFASLDVFEKEPLMKSSPLWQMKNVIITPHVASLTGVDSAVNYMYKKYNEFNKKGYLKSDVDNNKGY